MKRASYREGVAWIAANDDPGETDPMIIKGFVSSLLLADLFDVPEERVANDIAKIRARGRRPT